MRRRLTCAFASLLVAGCMCEENGVGDAGTDSGTLVDASPDAPRDVGVDAWVAPELILDVVDPTPCPSVSALPRRARALPADATPRVLWQRSLREITAEGPVTESQAIGRDGHIHFSVSGIVHQHFELNAEGTSLGEGVAVGRTKGPTGPMSGLFDGRVAEWTRDFVRLDLRPPQTDSATLLSFPMVPPRGFDQADLASTSDGFYAFRESHGVIRKYCADGRLQWQISGLDNPFLSQIQVEDDDSIWFNAGPATGSAVVRADRNGAIVERVPWPEGSSHLDMGVGFSGSTRIVNVSSEDERTTWFVAIEESTGRELYRVEAPFADVSEVRVDPFGALWLGRRGEEITRYVDGEPVATSPLAGIHDAIMTADGSFVMQGGTLEDPTVVRLLPDGTVGWELPMPAFTSYMILDVDGRLYCFGQDLVVVQTDVLPPNVRGCWQRRCTPQADNRIGAGPD